MFRWLELALFYVSLFLSAFLLAEKLRADPMQEERRNLANETFEFLRLHCIPFEEDPSQWAYDGCYSMHRAARDLYSARPLGQIEYPESDWNRGGYSSYYNPVDFLAHEWLRARIYLMLNMGRNGIPPRHMNGPQGPSKRGA